MAALDLKALTISVVPGTGTRGGLLAAHFANAGLRVIVGSRDVEKAAVAAAEISKQIPLHLAVKGLSNADAAAAGDIIIWGPSGSLQDRAVLLMSLAKHLRNKIIVDATNIGYFLNESNWGQVSSVCLNKRALCHAVRVRWTTAFKTAFPKLLTETPDVNNPHTEFVCGDDDEAVNTTIALVNCIPGFKGLYAGGLRNTKIVELLSWPLAVQLDKFNFNGECKSGYRYGSNSSLHPPPRPAVTDNSALELSMQLQNTARGLSDGHTSEVCSAQSSCLAAATDECSELRISFC